MGFRSEEINVCLSTDDNYAQYAGVVIASILKNASINDKLHFYILDGGITQDKKEKLLSLKSIKDCVIDFVNIDKCLFEEYAKVPTHKYISIAAYYRLRMPSLLPKVKRIIYFDCDIVVNSSLAKLFKTEMGEYPIAGVRDIDKRKIRKNPTYVNSGMLVMDLDNMRKIKLEEELLNWTKTHFDEIYMGDQQIINAVCKNRTVIVDDRWNVQSSNFTNRSSYTNHPKIIHYVSAKKPWHFGSFSYHRPLYFKYLQLTPWKLDEKEYKHWTQDNQIKSLIGYVKYRPLFLLRPRFYEALFKTYIQPLLEYKKPVIKNNTFLLWEPCSKSHSEVLPGYTKYLLDLGYHVSVLATPARYKEGLFDRFKDKNLTLNKMSQKQIRKFFEKDSLDDVEGALITTVGKLCDEIDFTQAYSHFNPATDKHKLLFVAHEAEHGVNNNSWNEKLITLRELDYKGAKSVVVNPHYFGEVKVTPKNKEITNFITIGAIKQGKKDSHMIIDAVRDLDKKGYKNFKVTVVGKGSMKDLPRELHKYFDIKGRLPFNKMYDELEKADFLLTAYNDKDPKHIRYNTTGTSGNFQLVYGFLKPCVIVGSFAPINGFDETNSIIYNKSEEYSDAMEKGIKITAKEYEKMQKSLKKYVDKFYKTSLNNLKGLINE